MVGVLLFVGFATRSFSNLHPGGAPESKEWEEAKLSGPGKHSQSARVSFLFVNERAI